MAKENSTVEQRHTIRNHNELCHLRPHLHVEILHNVPQQNRITTGAKLILFQSMGTCEREIQN